MIDLGQILRDKQFVIYQQHGINVAKVDTMYEGFRIARETLYSIVDKTTVLYLSGGRTPKDLYENLANDKKILPGAVALVDERFGPKGHANSNEKMITESGFMPYLAESGVPFYPILQPFDQAMPAGRQAQGQRDNKPGIREVADNYDMTVRYLFSGFPKSVATLGVGIDGHTAGIAGNRPDVLGTAGFHNPMFDMEQKNLLVSYFSDMQGMFKERISLTFLGLSMIDVFIVMVFGNDKRETLAKVFAEGSEEDVPARFLKRPEIARRTLLITDQKV